MSILALTSDTLIGTAAAGNIEYNGQFFGTDSNASRAQLQRIVQGTAVASTSGTSIDFTSLPAWCKKITVMFSGVSTSGTSAYLAQIGSGSVVTTGYGSTMSLIVNATASTSNTSSGFLVNTAGNAAGIHSGTLVLSLISATTWVGTVVMAQADSTRSMFGAGNSASLSGALDRVRITTVNGTDTFDAGSINILYEG